jgi:hypothetical protein
MDISSSIDRAVSTYFSNWLGQHPYLAWSIAHPLPSLGLLLVLILSLVGLFGAIGRGVEQIWLFLLKTPFKLLQPIFSLIWSVLSRGLGRGNLVDPNLSPERIDVIVDRLQSLSQEQERLLTELATLRSGSIVGVLLPKQTLRERLRIAKGEAPPAAQVVSPHEQRNTPS